MTLSVGVHRQHCANCPIKQEIKDIIACHKDFVTAAEQRDVRLWPDYHRASYRAKLVCIKDFITELSFTLNDPNGGQEVYDNL